MKMPRIKKRGLSPVIATIILSAVVIAIGGAIWSYSQGASTVIANSYVNDTLELLNEVTERFAVEHVSNNTEGSILHVWVYNYGEVDIVIDVYANATHFNETTSTFNSTFSANYTTSITAGILVLIEIDFSSYNLFPSDEVAVKVHSRRQNNAYYKYYVR
jgi:flagellin-like protein